MTFANDYDRFLMFLDRAHTALALQPPDESINRAQRPLASVRVHLHAATTAAAATLLLVYINMRACVEAHDGILFDPHHVELVVTPLYERLWTAARRIVKHLKVRRND